MSILEQVGFHPWPAILGGVAIVLNAIFLVRRPKGGRAWLLPGVAGFACAAVAIGVFWNAWILIAGFRAMALAGLGGQGSFAVLLAEARSAFFAGPVAAALVLATGLLLAPNGDDGGTTEAASGSSLSSQLRALLVLSGLLAVLVVALSVYDHLFAATLPQRVFGAEMNANPGEVGEVIASHLVRLEILSGLAFAASALLASLPSRLATMGWPPRALVSWGRALLMVLLILAVTGATMAWRQQARFTEAAMIGQFE